MEFPKVDICDETIHQEELERLNELRNFIYKGHIDAFHSHHKYFFDTEAFVRKGNKVFNKWLSKKLKTEPVFNQKNFNIIITPNAEAESDLVCAVNDIIFNGNALIVYLDVTKENNNNHKLASLKNMDKTNVSFHYVDHLLLTGETYRRTKSEIDSTKFDSIITIINRLPYKKCKDIKNEVNHFFAFINLYYPTSGKCELCTLEKYYDDLSKKTVLDSCKQVISDNIRKLNLKSRRDIKWDAHKNKRDFLRLVVAHELYYRISQIAYGKANFYDLTKDEIFSELDAIYCKLCNKDWNRDKETKSNINVFIDKWFRLYFAERHEKYQELHEFHKQKLESDKIISFLKVISSPPLSKYIIIRQYAHSKLLTVLDEIINNKNENDNIYVDLKIVKSILKSLSFLKSNALVRKDVIVGVWKILGKAHHHLSEDLTNINNRIGDCQDIIKSIEDKQQELSRNGHFIPYLEDQKKEANEYLKYLEDEKKHLIEFITKDEIVKDFSRDFQFFIKNAIVEDDAKATFLGELLRQGTEMTSFDHISISKTILSKKDNNNQSNENVLFNCFNKYPNETLRKEYINFLVWLSSSK